MSWFRYDHVRRAAGAEADALLDEFMPNYEAVEQHRMRVAAPAETTFAAACDMDLQHSAVIRAVFRARELILRSKPDETPRPRGLVALTKSRLGRAGRGSGARDRDGRSYPAVVGEPRVSAIGAGGIRCVW